jgi:hypothetical protein
MADGSVTSKTIVSETRGLKTAPFRPGFPDGWVFEGTNGFIAGTSLFDPDGKLVSTFSGQSESHFANFLGAVRSRKREQLHADILETHLSSALCHLGNISWRLGHAAAPAELRQELAKIKAHETVLETFDRTAQHLRENQLDLERTKLTLGPLLRFDSVREAFINLPQADALLGREYRQPFVVPSASEI